MLAHAHAVARHVAGILPYTLPLFCGLPFHEATVYAVNVLLTLHACVLHSSCHRDYAELSKSLGWLMISPIGHNMHHQVCSLTASNSSRLVRPLMPVLRRCVCTVRPTQRMQFRAHIQAVGPLARNPKRG